MQAERTAGRGERARVAARVRELFAEEDDEPFAARAYPASSFPSGGPRRRERLAERVAQKLTVRVDPGRRAAGAVALAVLVVAVLTGIWVFSARPRAMALRQPLTPAVVTVASASSSVSIAPATAGVLPSGSVAPAAAGNTSTGTGAPGIVVDVAGRVRHPGLYTLASGARVGDALIAAGGALPSVNLTRLNLAAVLVDGQQIAVGTPGAPAGGPAAVGGLPASTLGTLAGPVDLNTASLEQLDTLPGVGPVLGQNILDWRAAHGSFTTIDQLIDVSGIGDAKFAVLKSLVTL